MCEEISLLISGVSSQSSNAVTATEKSERSTSSSPANQIVTTLTQSPRTTQTYSVIPIESKASSRQGRPNSSSEGPQSNTQPPESIVTASAKHPTSADGLSHIETMSTTLGAELSSPSVSACAVKLVTVLQYGLSELSNRNSQ